MLDGQGFELPFGLDMSDLRALDFRQGLIDGNQGLVKPRSDGLNVAKREFDRVELRPQIFIPPADRVESGSDLLRLRRLLTAARRRRAPGRLPVGVIAERGLLSVLRWRRTVRE